jgi:tetratricopeptide (TPR) repeat protein
MKKYLILFCCLAALITGCSSLPEETEPQSLTFAHMKMKAAREAQKRQEFNKSLGLYKDAYDLFTRLDDIRGKIDASLAVARQYFYLDKREETTKWLDRAAALIETHMPRMAASRSILLAEMAFAEEDYRKVIEVAEEALTSPPLRGLDIEGETEMLCYAMVAKAQLKLDYRPEFNRVQWALTQLQKRFDKKKLADPEVLSLACYYTAYIYSTIENNWRDALRFFEQAKEIDSFIDHPYGVGKDLYSMGRCYEELGFFEKAGSSFERAAEIFTLLQDAAMAEKAAKRAKAVREQIR